MIIKELLNGKKELIVILNSFNRETFLQQAKNEGFMWKSSKEIKGSDNCFFHVFVKDDLTISNLSTMILVNSNDFNQVAKFKY